MNEWINELKELPQKIADAETAVAQLRQSAKDLRSDLAEREIVIVTSATAKEWGSNAEERKINQSAAMNNDVQWSAINSAIAETDALLVAAEIRLNLQRNNFYAARSIALIIAGAGLLVESAAYAD